MKEEEWNCNHCGEKMTKEDYEKYHGMCKYHFMNGTFKVIKQHDGRIVTRRI